MHAMYMCERASVCVCPRPIHHLHVHVYMHAMYMCERAKVCVSILCVQVCVRECLCVQLKVRRIFTRAIKCSRNIFSLWHAYSHTHTHTQAILARYTSQLGGALELAELSQTHTQPQTQHTLTHHAGQVHQQLGGALGLAELSQTHTHTHTHTQAHTNTPCWPGTPAAWRSSRIGGPQSQTSLWSTFQ